MKYVEHSKKIANDTFQVDQNHDLEDLRSKSSYVPGGA
jgi:hypothetical protein